MSAVVVELNDGNFATEVLESEQPVLVDFWAEWCGPCRMLAPVIEELAGEYTGKVKICKINVDGAQKTTGEYGIMNIPTVLFFKNGEMVDKVMGILPKDAIAAKIEALL